MHDELINLIDCVSACTVAYKVRRETRLSEIEGMLRGLAVIVKGRVFLGKEMVT